VSNENKWVLLGNNAEHPSKKDWAKEGKVCIPAFFLFSFFVTLKPRVE